MLIIFNLSSPFVSTVQNFLSADTRIFILCSVFIKVFQDIIIRKYLEKEKKFKFECYSINKGNYITKIFPITFSAVLGISL